MEIKDIAKKLAEYIALFAVFGTIGTWWLNTEIERRMGELATDPASSPAVVVLATKVDNIEAGQVRIEGKVDAFSQKFLEYLEREASR